MPDLSYFPLAAPVRATFAVTAGEPETTGTIVAVEQESGMPVPQRYLVVLDEAGNGPVWVDHGKVVSAAL